MELPLYAARIYLYWIFLFWTILVFALSVARLSYTENLPSGDPLNGGINFYDPSVAALLFSSLLALIYVPFILYALHKPFIYQPFTTVAFEIGAAVMIWMFWLGSTAAATNVWPDLSFCVQFRACTNLQAMLAFAWLGWITLSVLLLITVTPVLRGNAWGDQSHDPWSDKPLFGGQSNLPRIPPVDYGSEGPSGPQMRINRDA